MLDGVSYFMMAFLFYSQSTNFNKFEQLLHQAPKTRGYI